MTLVLAVTANNSVWMMTDQRLTCRGSAIKEDARKLMRLETIDGSGILGYAGLGSTPKGTEPSKWMACVLRGQNMSFEHSLSVLSQAVQSRLPIHLARLNVTGASSHHILASCFVDGEPRLYSIDLILHPCHSTTSFRFTRLVRELPNSVRTPPPHIAMRGSGAFRVQSDKISRNLLKMVAAHETGRISAEAVACALARINRAVAEVDATVGERCIVSWQYRKGGGAQAFFDCNGVRDSSDAWLPSIGRGLDIAAVGETIIRVLGPTMLATLEGDQRAPDWNALNAELAKLPKGADDTLI
jgi:hypothetical protein